MALARRKFPDTVLAQDAGVGMRLKEIRYKSYNPKTGKHYTQEELAAKWRRDTGERIHPSSLKNYETNRRETPHRFLVLYRNLLPGYTVDYILTGNHPDDGDTVKRLMMAFKGLDDGR